MNIVEVPDTVRWMRGGEIMFSSGFAFGGDGDKGCALISSLWDHKMTALVLKPGIYMARVPEAMIEYAEYLGFPLIGDYLYNPDMEYISRQALHSCRLRFVHPITKERMEFRAPLPEDMQIPFQWDYGYEI